MKLWMAPGGLHIEMAHTKHVSAMAKLHSDSFFRGWSETEFSAYLQKPHQNPVYVACDAKNRVAGFMVLSLLDQESELLSISVQPKWRKKGVGKSILQAGLDDVLTAGVTAMFLEVDEKNISAIALYGQFGFSEVGRRAGYYPLKNGQNATALVMRTNFN